MRDREQQERREAEGIAYFVGALLAVLDTLPYDSTDPPRGRRLDRRREWVLINRGWGSQVAETTYIIGSEGAAHLLDEMTSSSVGDRSPLSAVAAGSDTESASSNEPEFSIVIPCLNEADTIEVCVQKAWKALHDHGIKGEILVADNGSTDDSQEIARRNGARVVPVAARGYGSALMGGIAAARGRFLIMADADDSYDFLEIPKFVGPLRAGVELVQGCRLESGGGRVLPGAMPVLHRWLGNPMFSWMARRWFGAPVKDVYCGFRGFRRDLYERLHQRCTGMEFATEMVVKASLYGARIAEVPITLHPDGRTSHAPHLKTFRDGWRTLRFFLMYSPRWLFLVPGLALVFFGLLGYAIAMPGLRIGGVTFDAHTLLFSSLAIMCGYQSILFAFLAKVFAISEGMLPEDSFMDRLFELVNLEKGLLVGGGATLTGLILLLGAVYQWRLRNFASLDYAHTMRWVVPGVTLTALGFQTILASFFTSLLGMRRK